MRHVWTREDLLWVPPTFAALSLLYISSKALREYIVSERKNGKAALLLAEDEDGHTDTANRKSLRDTVKALDGFSILSYRLLRLLTVFGLLSLEVYETSIGHGPSARTLQIAFYVRFVSFDCRISCVLDTNLSPKVYLLVLASVSVAATSPRWRDLASFDLATLFFLNFLVYFVLDVWPYAMINPAPFDPPSEASTLIRILLLTLGGLVIPLIMPRPFRPSTPDDEPSSQETCCLLSRYLYSYLDRIVFHAYRVPDITVKDMPQLSGPAKIEMLGKRALSALDPVEVGKRHIVWGILRIWGKDFILMMIFIGLYCFAEFAAPYGMRHLLA